MIITKILSRWAELGYKDKTMDEEFEFDVVNVVKHILDCVESFETGNRLFTRPSDLDELIRYLDTGLNNIKHSKGYFELTPKQKQLLRD